jgi:hypothetical protein
LQKWRRRITPLTRKAHQPSDDALMRSEPRLRKFCITKIADLLIAKFSIDTATARRYDRSGLAFKFAPIALCFTIKIYEISFAVGTKKFYKAPF